MGFNFIAADRDQAFLLPPDMRDWLPADHLAWFIVEVVDQLDLGDFQRAYRNDGHGRAAYDPAVMVAVLLYGYCTGVRSSRTLERLCREHIAYRVLAGGLSPDHVTLARFRSRHAEALAGLFVASLRLCAEAGLVKVGQVAIDGTKIGADAALDANVTLETLAKQMTALIAEAEALDAAENAGAGSTSETPAVDPAKRRAQIAAAKARLEAAKKRLDEDAETRAKRFTDRQDAVNAARAAKGQAPRECKPRKRDEAPRPAAATNLTDPDSRMMKTRRGNVQGYNAQLATTAEQVIIAAEVSQAVNDVEQLEPVLKASRANLAAAGVNEPIGALAADSGYWRAANVDGSIADAPDLFIPVAKHGRRGKEPAEGRASQDKTSHLVEAMTAKLDTETGKALRRMRSTTVEPVFGQTKAARGIRTFTRRGLPAARAEWRLIAATHNLGKLHRARVRAASSLPTTAAA